MSAKAASPNDVSPQGSESQRPPPPGLGPILGKVTANGVILVLVFWLVACWLYGVFYNSSNHVHQLTVLVSNFDQGVIGQAFLQAIASVNGRANVPNYVVLPPASTSPEEMTKKLWDGKVWGVIYTAANASQLFQSALNDATAAASYDPTNAIHYAGLEVRWNSLWAGALLPNFQRVVATTQGIFTKTVTSPMLSQRMFPATQAEVVLNPISSTYHNLTPFGMGIRGMLNSVGFVFPTLLIFFFMLGFNGAFAMSGIRKRMSFVKNWTIVTAVGLVWPLVASLCVVGWIMVFKESVVVKARDFFALWAVVWLFEIIMFDILFGVVTFVPLPFVPPIVVIIIIVSVASVAYPTDAAYRFYEVHHAIPAHAAWAIMVTILGQGAANTVKVDLPILFAWFIVTKIVTFFAVKKSAA